MKIIFIVLFVFLLGAWRDSQTNVHELQQAKSTTQNLTVVDLIKLANCEDNKCIEEMIFKKGFAFSKLMYDTSRVLNKQLAYFYNAADSSKMESFASYFSVGKAKLEWINSVTVRTYDESYYNRLVQELISKKFHVTNVVGEEGVIGEPKSDHMGEIDSIYTSKDYLKYEVAAAMIGQPLGIWYSIHVSRKR